MGGRDITTQPPVISESEFYDPEQYLSVVLMALVDADYCFMFADCGSQGTLNDGAVLKNTSLFKKIEQNQLQCPPKEPLPGRNTPVPYVFVGDDAFGLRTTIMKPFPGKHEKGSRSRIFNYHISRARRLVENTFGLLANVFRVLQKPMLLQSDKVASVVLTCALLHNFLRRSKSSQSQYSPIGTFDYEQDGNIIEGAWRQPNNDNMKSLIAPRNIPRRASIEAKEIRNEFAEYFSTSGKIPWQDRYY